MFEQFKSKEKKDYSYIKDGVIVNVKRSNGVIEGDWVVLHVDEKEGRVLVAKNDSERGLLRKKISIDELVKLNPNTGEPLEKHKFED